MLQGWSCCVCISLGVQEPPTDCRLLVLLSSCGAQCENAALLADGFQSRCCLQASLRQRGPSGRRAGKHCPSTAWLPIGTPRVSVFTWKALYLEDAFRMDCPNALLARIFLLSLCNYFSHTTPGEGAEYVRLTFGTAGGAATEVDDPSTVIDAEFLFLKGELGLAGCCRLRGVCCHSLCTL